MNTLRNSNRNGITLLFVISIIVLFLLMGTAFVVLAGDYLRGTKLITRIENEKFEQPEAVIEKAAYEVFRGPELTDVNSPLRFQDILADQYGYGLRAVLWGDPDNPSLTPITFAPNSNNQIVRIRLRHPVHPNNPADPTNLARNRALKILPSRDATGALIPRTSIALSHFAESYAGHVVSFTTGPSTVKGYSGRVVHHEIDLTDPSDPEHWLWLPAQDIDVESLTTYLRDTFANNPPTPIDVIINNRDFAGNGPGFDPTADPGVPAFRSPFALNPRGVVGMGLDNLVRNPNNPSDFSWYVSDNSTNEPWDAADQWSNLFLSGYNDDVNPGPIASFHRDSPQNTLRAFVGSPTLEVDADNDGVSDSVWMDLNFPARSHKDKFYKPLFAIKVMDLDGRLNLNAHGDMADTAPDYFIAERVPMLGGIDSLDLPRGLGMGPAEISLRRLPGIDTDGYQRLILGRYGEDGVPGAVRNNIDVNIDNSISITRTQLFGHPFDILDWNTGRFGTVGHLYASSPMDIRGRFAIGTPQLAALARSQDSFVDLNDTNFPNGMPVIDVNRSSLHLTQLERNRKEITRSNYGLSFAPIPWNNQSTLDRDSNLRYVDTPYTELELERILRPHDLDVKLLSSRLWNQVSTNPESFWRLNRDHVTTSSYEVLTSDFERLLFRKISGSSFELLTDTQRDTARAQVEAIKAANLFAPELFQGLKMDVNRPLGNGYDDDGDGIVDNPGEEIVEVNLDQQNYYDSIRPPTHFRMDLNQDGLFNNDDLAARQIYARHLYCLTLLVTDNYATHLRTIDPDQYEHYVRTIAQWAVNVVDFRDPDSIMTRFHFDPQPFADQSGTGNLWDPPMNGTDPDPEFVVWGMERPELLITETFAAHARRSQPDPSNPGQYQQGLRPEPFAFIELYNPWTQNSFNQQFDSSLYNNQGVNLSRTVGATEQDPVWRVRIDRPRSIDPDQATTPLRYVYFTDPGSNPRGEAADSEAFFTTYPTLPVRPGSQALIGTEGTPAPNSRFRSYMGRLQGKTQADEATNDLELDSTSYLEIDRANRMVRKYLPNTDTIEERRVSTIVPVNRYRGQANPTTNPRPFNVSDPRGGYPTVVAPNATPVPDGFRYTSPISPVLDSELNPDENRDDVDFAAIQQHGRTTERFRIIYLERLANPSLPWDPDTNPYMAVDELAMDLVAFNGTRDEGDDPPPSGTPGTTYESADALERNSSTSLGQRVLWASADPRRRSVTDSAPGNYTTPHFFNWILRDSLGKTNDLLYPNGAGDLTPLAGLTWNNRPYVSHYELMNVSYTASGPISGETQMNHWLNQRFSLLRSSPPYSGPFPGVPALSTYPYLGGNFGHLLNFYLEGDETDSPHLYRIFEYLTVPSRYAGTTVELIPSGGTPGFALNPFNTLSRYREPGKINLNTIYSEQVYLGLMGNYATIPGGLTWNQFKENRLIGANGENPFRPAGTGNFAPHVDFVTAGPRSTLFRGSASNPAEPLFDFKATTANLPAMASDRNAFFRHQMRQRLANLTTNRSSVFAIWITVGYFECDGQGVLKGSHAELGVDDGTNRRNRGFFIFDRSIPVAYEPGKNHNIDKAILVRRIIE